MFSRAARTAGRKPPTTPITTANTRALLTTPGDSANPKPISEKLWKLMTEIRANDSRAASATPSAPPTSASITDSSRNAPRTLRRPNPRARKVPTSTVRFATAAYMMITMDAPPPESQGPQGAHFDRAVRDCGVHGDHRADHRAEAEDGGHHQPENPDERRECLGLLLVILPLVLELHVLHAGVRLEAGLELIEVAGVGEEIGQGRIDRATERLHELVGEIG